MHGDIERVLIPQERIAARVRELAQQITIDHCPPRLSLDAGLTVVPIMTGAMIFCADLIRHMPIEMRIGLLSVSSYPGSATTGREPSVLLRPGGELRGRHVLLVDDILDSGRTLAKVAPLLLEAGAAAVKTCVLLRKQIAANRGVCADYVGFDIPDEFVVGYGLDYDDRYRNLPDVVTLRPHLPASRR